jgi:hypothetical protein
MEKKENKMSTQSINQLGSDVRRLHNEVVELTACNMATDKVQTEFTSQLLSLINRALDSEEMVEKLFKLIEKT